MSEEGTKEMDVEEKVQEEALSLLLQGKFQDCFLLCQRFFNTRPSDARSNLLPDVDFQTDYNSNTPLNPAFSLCLTYLQCLYELHQASEFEEDVEESVRQGLGRVESFLVQKSPVPFVVALTWIQLLIQLNDCQKAKQMLTSSLNALAKEVHVNKSSSEEKRSKYALLANLYTVYTLPKLGHLVNAKRFLAMHKNGTLLTQAQILTMMQALDGFTSSDESTVGAAASANPGVEPEERTPSPDGAEPQTNPVPVNVQSPGEGTSLPSGEETKARDKGEGPHEIVLSVEQAAGIAVGAVLLATLLVKRNSLRSMFRTNISRVGDAVFGP